MITAVLAADLNMSMYFYPANADALFKAENAHPNQVVATPTKATKKDKKTTEKTHQKKM